MKDEPQKQPHDNKNQPADNAGNTDSALEPSLDIDNLLAAAAQDLDMLDEQLGELPADTADNSGITDATDGSNANTIAEEVPDTTEVADARAVADITDTKDTTGTTDTTASHTEDITEDSQSPETAPPSPTTAKMDITPSENAKTDISATDNTKSDEPDSIISEPASQSTGMASATPPEHLAQPSAMSDSSNVDQQTDQPDKSDNQIGQEPGDIDATLLDIEKDLNSLLTDITGSDTDNDTDNSPSTDANAEASVSPDAVLATDNIKSEVETTAENEPEATTEAEVTAAARSESETIENVSGPIDEPTKEHIEELGNVIEELASMGIGSDEANTTSDDSEVSTQADTPQSPQRDIPVDTNAGNDSETNAEIDQEIDEVIQKGHTSTPVSQNEINKTQETTESTTVASAASAENNTSSNRKSVNPESAGFNLAQRAVISSLTAANKPFGFVSDSQKDVLGIVALVTLIVSMLAVAFMLLLK